MSKPQTQEGKASSDVYEALARHLDQLPAGFARTESGVELRILRRLFTPEDAALAVHLTILPEEPRVVARRAGIPVAEAARRLAEMGKKGLILRMEEPGKPPRYMAMQYAIGFWETQVNRLTPELARDTREYAAAYIDPNHWRKAPQLRTIPVGKSIDARNEVMPYEIAEELMRFPGTRAVANCICRQAARLVGRGCGKFEESCLTLGPMADYMIRSGRARAVSLEESLEILRRADETGLVLQPDNAQDPAFICTCCGCCCAVLCSIKRHPKPGRIISSPFLAHFDSGKCKGCGLCAKRCQMDAIYLEPSRVVLDLDRCIGCGLCVSTCPTHALSLARKPQTEQADIPKDHVESYLKLAQARGKLRTAELVRLQLKSKFDRLLARTQ